MSPLRAFTNRNYRLFYAGTTVSNVGTWMQRIAQDWLVLTRLTHGDVAAVGIVTALQFLPQILLGAIAGRFADVGDRRRLLLGTQIAFALLAAGLGALVMAGAVRLWEVYAFAFGTGIVAALDTPANQAFVSDLVPEADLPNAIALNSVSWAASRMIGPAAAGFAIEALGLGPSFLANAASNCAVAVVLTFLPSVSGHHEIQTEAPSGGLGEGFRHIARRPDIRAVFVMMLLTALIGFNFPIFVSAMTVRVFHRDAADFGLLTASLAVGALVGAVLTTRRLEPRLEHLVTAAALFGGGLLACGIAPGYGTFAVALVVVGYAVQTYTTTTNSLLQVSTARSMRGRVMSIVMMALGAISLAAPALGAAADRFGPRATLLAGAVAAIAAAAIGRHELARQKRDAIPGIE